MNEYKLIIIKTTKEQKPYQLFKEGKLTAEGKATKENLFKLFIDKHNPQIDFVEKFSDKANG